MVNDMTKIEAYRILAKMWNDLTPEQDEAINIAMDCIEFVDLMPTDMARVVFCADCTKHGNDEECPLLSMMAYTDPTDHCSYGEQKEADANG